MDPQYAYQSAPFNTPTMSSAGMPAAAQQLQSMGRGNDSLLVHMTPGEVGGLQALAMSHGGSLTTNPSTGLPEAGFLQRLLPTLLGAGLTVASGGVINPLMAAGIVGAGYGVAKGSLKEGLMAGLGAYGGAGLGAGLVGAGTAAAKDVATQSLLGSEATNQAIVQQAAAQGIAPSEIAREMAAGFKPDALSGLAGTQQAAAAKFAELPALTQAKEGMQALGSKVGQQAFMEGMKSVPYAGTAATVSGLSALAEPPKSTSPSESYIRPYEFDWNKQVGAFSPSPTPGDSSERLYFQPRFTPLPIYRAAKGGEVDPMDEMTEDGAGSGFAPGGDVGLSALNKKRKTLMGDKLYKFSQDRRDQSMESAIEQNFAQGGLGAALPPRFLSGGGDGMSDSIKANIDGKQEARLADGEFVIPADVVSHLGNGSSKAGAKKLYAMMDKIRKARTGKTRQAPEVNAAKYMPA